MPLSGVIKHHRKQWNKQRVAWHAHLGGGHGLPCLCLRLSLLLCLHPVSICALHRLRRARSGVGSRPAIAFCVLHFLGLLLDVRHVVDEMVILRNDDRSGLHKGWLPSGKGLAHRPHTQVGHMCAICCASNSASNVTRPHLPPVCPRGWLPTPVGRLQSSGLRAGAASQQQKRQPQPCTAPAATRARGAVTCRPGARRSARSRRHPQGRRRLLRRCRRAHRHHLLLRCALVVCTNQPFSSPLWCSRGPCPAHAGVVISRQDVSGAAAPQNGKRYHIHTMGYTFRHVPPRSGSSMPLQTEIMRRCVSHLSWTARCLVKLFGCSENVPQMPDEPGGQRAHGGHAGGGGVSVRGGRQ